MGTGGGPRAPSPPHSPNMRRPALLPLLLACALLLPAAAVAQSGGREAKVLQASLLARWTPAPIEAEIAEAIAANDHSGRGEPLFWAFFDWAMAESQPPSADARKRAREGKKLSELVYLSGGASAVTPQQRHERTMAAAADIMNSTSAAQGSIGTGGLQLSIANHEFSPRLQFYRSIAGEVWAAVRGPELQFGTPAANATR